MHKRYINIGVCFTALLLGGILYILFRPTTYVGCFFSNIEIVRNVQMYFLQFKLDFVRYYLPDYLWGFSLCCGLVGIFDATKKNLLICGIVTFLFGLCWEVSQHFKITSGFFDIIDIVMYFLATLSTLLINLKEIKK